MTWIKKSIRTKIVMTVFACIIAFALIACPAILLTISSIHERQLATQAESVLRGCENALASRRDNVLLQVSVLAGSKAAGFTTNGQQALVERLRQETEFGASNFFIVADPAGTIIASTLSSDSLPENLASSLLFEEAASGSTGSGIERLSQKLLAVGAAAPIMGTTGMVEGVLLGGIDLADTQFTLEMNRIYQVDSAIYAGDALLSSTPLHQQALPGQQLAPATTDSLASGNPVIKAQRFGEVRVQGTYLPLLDSSGTLQGVFYNGIDRTQDDRTVMIFIVLLLTGICILCVIALWMIDLVVKGVAVRVNSMVASAAEISNGNLSGDIHVEGSDEVAHLGEAFAQMAKGIRNQAQVVEAMAEGDFSVEVPVRSQQDVMGQSLKKMAENLSHMLVSIGSATGQVTGGSRLISNGAHQLANASAEQTQATEALSESITHISGLIGDSQQKMARAAALTGEIQLMAREGSSKMSHMTAAVSDIDNANEEIRKIMKVIEDISFQTNILALNASVEAARAGEHGKGFAVVADEVRSLAAKSAQAAKETHALIENTISKTKMGTTLTGETAEYFGRIVQSVEESNLVIQQAAEQAQAQAALIGAINQDIGNVTNVVRQNAATAQESAASSQSMQAQADILSNLVSRFKAMDNE